MTTGAFHRSRWGLEISILFFLSWIAALAIRWFGPYSIVFLLIPFFLFISSKKLLVPLLFAALMLSGLSSYSELLPRQLGWSVELLILVMFLKLMGSQPSIKQIKPFYLVCLLLMATFSILSSFANGNSLLVMLVGIRKYYRFIILFLIIAMLKWTEREKQILLAIIVAVAYVQLPVAFWQWRVYGPGDVVSGTMGPGGSGILAVFQLFAFIIILAMTREASLRTRLIFGVGGLTLFIPTILGSAMIIFLAVPLVLVGFAFDTMRVERFRSIIFVVIFAVFLSVIFPSMRAFNDSLGWMTFDRLFESAGSAYQYDIGASRFGTLGRLGQLEVAHIYVSQSIFSLLVGFGPGTASQSFFGSATGSLYLSNSIIVHVGSALPNTILELGYLGLGFLAMPIILARREGIALTRMGATRTTRTLGTILGLASPVFFLSGIYSNPWFADPTAATFWTLFGLTIAQSGYEGKSLRGPS